MIPHPTPEEFRKLYDEQLEKARNRASHPEYRGGTNPQVTEVFPNAWTTTLDGLNLMTPASQRKPPDVPSPTAESFENCGIDSRQSIKSALKLSYRVDVSGDCGTTSDAPIDSSASSSAEIKSVSFVEMGTDTTSTRSTSQVTASFSDAGSTALAGCPSNDPIAGLVNGIDIAIRPDQDKLELGVQAVNRERKRMLLHAMKTFETQGLKALIDCLLDFGAEDYKSHIPATLVVQDIKEKLSTRTSRTGMDFYSRSRLMAMAHISYHWHVEKEWMTVTEESILDRFRLAPKKVNIAGFMGSLCTIGILTVDDVHRCLALLMDHPDEFYGLCAIHALILQARNRLCTVESGNSMDEFVTKLYAKYPLEKCPAPVRFLIANIASYVNGSIARRLLKTCIIQPSGSSSPTPSPTTRGMTKETVSGRGYKKGKRRS